MATKNSLVKISTHTVTSSEATVTLTGISSTYDVYLVTFENVTVDVDNQSMILNFTTSGVADTTANYQVHTMSIRDAGDANRTQSSATYATICENLGLGSNEIANGNLLIFQAADSTANTGALVDTVYTTLSNTVRNEVGHIAHIVNETHDGVVFDIGGANNFTGGVFTLYGLIK